MKLKIINGKVFIDDKEIINVSKLLIHKEPNMPDRITLEFYVDEVEDFNKDVDSEDLTEAIIKNFNKSSYR